jgi:hypothetical protein
MSSPKVSRLAPSQSPSKNSPSKSDHKHASELNKWTESKLAEWDAGKQERDTRTTSLADNAQATARERNKKLEEDIRKMRDELDQKMAESKKTD